MTLRFAFQWSENENDSVGDSALASGHDGAVTTPFSNKTPSRSLLTTSGLVGSDGECECPYFGLVGGAANAISVIWARRRRIIIKHNRLTSESAGSCSGTCTPTGFGGGACTSCTGSSARFGGGACTSGTGSSVAHSPQVSQHILEAIQQQMHVTP
ncbi:hypothetical protein BGY98DRAFT_1101017 [Russula aff. rugulosa BPL654]|nr:hypothetical protein BGY98DRAFT_1101017 [Russula aff. rugulosa BPL654]